MSQNRSRARRSAFLRALAFWLLSSCLLATESPARADHRFAIEAFEPAPSLEGSLLNVYGARTLAPRAYTLSLLGSYGRKPLSIESRITGSTVGELIGSIGTLNLMAAVGLSKYLDVGISLPIHRVSEGSDFGAFPPTSISRALMDSTEVALGDLRLVPRVRFLARERDRGVGLALLVQTFLPTGKDAYYAGESFRIEPRVSLDWLSRRGALLAMNLGYLVRSKASVLGTPVNDMLRAGVGVDIPIAVGLSALAELDTQLATQAGEFGKAQAPTEGFLALRFRRAGWLAQLGGGPGIVRGISAPRYRLFAALSFSHQHALDPDGDGIVGKADHCPKEPEDRDGFQDADGCPDPDNDGDGVLDASDRCPNEPEDRDGFQDDDGCPDPDNDGDEIADADDRCPNEPGVPEQGGCPALPPPVSVVLTEKAIELRQPVFFATDRATIEERSHALLDEVASVLNAHPELERIAIEGHSDNTGSAAHNRTLSKARAAAVLDALVQRGVAPNRLRAVGFGLTRPVVPNDSDEHRAQNRRVEMPIERRTRPR
jgi:outer membrane protein OmpA-like peptidoglycan-associated protein